MNNEEAVLKAWSSQQVRRSHLSMAITLLSSALVCSIGLNVYSLKANIRQRPVIIRVDELTGRADQLYREEGNYHPHELEVKHFMGKFCEMYYSEVRSRIAQDKPQTLLFMEGQLAREEAQKWGNQKVIEKFVSSGQPDAEAQVRTVIVENLKKQPYQVRVDFWRVMRDPNGQEAKKLYTATIHFSCLLESEGSVPVGLIPVNPFGFLIHDFRVDEAFE